MTVDGEVASQVVTGARGPHARKLFLNSFFNLTGVVFPALIAVAATPLLLKALGPAHFGVLSIQMGLLVLVGINDFGVGRAVVLVAISRGGFHNVADRNAVVGAGLSLVSIISAVLIVGGLATLAVAVALSDPARAGNLASWGLILLSSAFSIPMLPMRAGMEVAERFGPLNVLRGMAAALLFLAPLIAVQMSPTLLAATAGLLVSRVAMMLAFGAEGGVLLLRTVATATLDLTHYARFRKLPPLQAELVRRGGWLGTAGTASVLLSYVDRFVLGLIVGAATVANYVIAAELATKLWLVIGAFIAAATPRIANGWSDTEGEGFRHSFGLLGASVLAIAFGIHAVFQVGGESILRLWLGAQYHPEMANLLRILSVGITINCLSQVNYLLLAISGRERAAAYIPLFTLPCTAAASLIAAHFFGGPGVAWTLSLRLLIDVFATKHIVARRGAGLKAGLPYWLTVVWAIAVVGLYVIARNS